MTNDNLVNRFSKIERDNIALMKRWFDEVWNDRRIETIHEFLSPDFVSHYEHEDIKGGNSYKEQLHDVLIKAISDFRIVIEDIIASGNYVVTRWQARGVHSGELLGLPPSGNTIEFNGMAWTKIVNGKITENWTNWSMSYFLRKLFDEVKMLQQILPICSGCKRIRGEGDKWWPLDAYVSAHTETDFTHTICPDCKDVFYSDL